MTDSKELHCPGEPVKVERGWTLYDGGDRLILHLPKGDDQPPSWQMLIKSLQYAIDNSLDFGLFFEVPHKEDKIQSLAMWCLNKPYVRKRDFSAREMELIRNGGWLPTEDGRYMKSDA